MKRYYMADWNRTHNGRIKRRVGKKRISRYYRQVKLLRKRENDSV